MQKLMPGGCLTQRGTAQVQIPWEMGHTLTQSQQRKYYRADNTFRHGRIDDRDSTLVICMPDWDCWRLRYGYEDCIRRGIR